MMIVLCVQKSEKKFFETSMGSLSEAQLMVAPPFWVCQVDIFGPCRIYTHGRSMPRGNKQAVEANVHVLMFACPTTKLCNLQVIESKSADGIIDGINLGSQAVLGNNEHCTKPCCFILPSLRTGELLANHQLPICMTYYSALLWLPPAIILK